MVENLKVEKETYSPIFGIYIEATFKSPNPERTARLLEWQRSYKPSDGYMIRARRKYIQTFTKLVFVGASYEQAAALIDYLANSFHFDAVEKLIPLEETQEAWLNIMGVRQPFIQDGKVVSGNVIKAGQAIINQLLGAKTKPIKIFTR